MVVSIIAAITSNEIDPIPYLSKIVASILSFAIVFMVGAIIISELNDALCFDQTNMTGVGPFFDCNDDKQIIPTKQEEISISKTDVQKFDDNQNIQNIGNTSWVSKNSGTIKMDTEKYDDFDDIDNLDILGDI